MTSSTSCVSVRLLNTNVEGKRKIMFALTSIKGAREVSPDELERLKNVVPNPRQFMKDYKDGRFSQVVSNTLDMKLGDDLERG
ncbi:hypothetical protein SETIT_2G055700v2 [Setaria italica]|uniref:Uncharacterized protein n=1 Tax=Setaria italica TaxID=4555 RepID=K4A1S6_SETIT|nr:hypothetical protein SETIT_2G055700v2 [Setaria italica]